MGLSGCSGRMNKDHLTGALPTVVGNNAWRAHSSITRLPLSCLSLSLYLLLTFIRETAHLVSNVSHSKCTKDDVTSRQFCWVPLIKLFINSFTETMWLFHVILHGITVISKDMSHLRTTKVVSKAALTLFSRPVSTHFKELPTDFFTREDLFLNQTSRQRHWDHPWLAQRRTFVITVENVEIVLVLTLVAMLVT